MKEFNIVAKLRNSLDAFETDSITIAENRKSKGAKFLSRDNNNLSFSQHNMISKIDYAMNSIFESGLYDTEGQRKVYLNIVRFVQRVSRMQTDVDVKNYVITPESNDDQWGAFLMSKDFKAYAKDEDYGEVLNRLGDDYTTYGTCVLKLVGDEVKRVPLKSLSNTQDAKSLKDAVCNGGYVIEEHEMSVYEMMEMPEWNCKGLDKTKNHKVYEIYTLMPKSYVESQNNRTYDDNEEMVQAMAVICLDKDNNNKVTEHIMFIEEIDEAPYEEARWEIIDGRWLGRGPVEDQLENQIARNMTANLRRRALLHSSKHIYQSSNEEVAKNLVKEVRDGQVMYVGPNGQITPVSNETRNLNEFSQDEAMWKENSQQLSFTFESATGESMTSGTPFRLGVLLSNTVASHFDLKKEQFGLFLKRSFFSQMIPIFQKQSRAKTMAIMGTEEGISHLKETVLTLKTNEQYVTDIMRGVATTYEETKMKVQDELNSKPYIFVDVPDRFFKDIKYHINLDITDESSDTKVEVETLTNLYTIMSQKGDSRADRVLEAILSKTGKNLQAIAGRASAPVAPQGGTAELSNLIPTKQNAPTTV